MEHGKDLGADEKRNVQNVYDNRRRYTKQEKRQVTSGKTEKSGTGRRFRRKWGTHETREQTTSRRVQNKIKELD